MRRAVSLSRRSLTRASKLTRRDETATLTNFQTKAFLRFFPSSLDAIPKLTRRDETATLTNFQTKAFLRFFPSSLDAIHMSHADDGDDALAFAPK